MKIKRVEGGIFFRVDQDKGNTTFFFALWRWYSLSNHTAGKWTSEYTYWVSLSESVKVDSTLTLKSSSTKLLWKYKHKLKKQSKCLTKRQVLVWKWMANHMARAQIISIHNERKWHWSKTLNKIKRQNTRLWVCQTSHNSDLVLFVSTQSSGLSLSKPTSGKHAFRRWPTKLIKLNKRKQT